MRYLNKTFIIFTVLIFILPIPVSALKVGVTLHAYYSWVKNIIGDKAEVFPLIETGNNVHNYQPRPADVERVLNMDVLVVNGIGHDEFAFSILKAASLDKKLPLIYTNESVALVPVGGTKGKGQINSHTFVSITSSSQQIYTIARKLGELDKKNSQYYNQNARNYVKRLRKIKASYMNKLAGRDNLDLRCATIHGGYDYLLQEFGLQVVAVVEPSHGISPTASQMKEMIDTLKKLNVEIIFTEMSFGPAYIDMIKKETGIRVGTLSHLSSGKFSSENFEIGISKNMETIVNTLLGNDYKEAK